MSIICQIDQIPCVFKYKKSALGIQKVQGHSLPVPGAKELTMVWHVGDVARENVYTL